MKRIYLGSLSLIAFLLSYGVAAAYGVAQDGRVNAKGLYAADVNIDGRAFNASINGCVAFGIVLYDDTTKRQVQSGELSCAGNVAVDGTCHNGHFYNERYGAQGYFCTEGGTFSTWTDYEHDVSRPPGSSVATSIAGDGTAIQQGAFYQTDKLQNLVWAEATNATTCPPGGNSVNFNHWQYQASDLNYYYVTTAPVSNRPDYICFSVGALSSTGAFNVAN